MQASSDTDKGLCVDGEDVSLQFSLQESEDGDPDLIMLTVLLRMVQPWQWLQMDLQEEGSSP